MVVDALSTSPLDWVFLTVISFKVDSVVHLWLADAFILSQKLVTILCVSFIMVLFPSGDGITEKISITTLRSRQEN